MASVTVVGASGYLGSELLRLLVSHPKIDKIVPVSRSFAGKPVHSLHKNLYDITDAVFTDLDLGKIDTEIAFFAAPPGEWFASLPELLGKGIKVITLGGKFRIQDAKIDNEVYGGYINHDLLSERVYGMPEIYRKDIRKARFVTNPGCYATSIILGIKPLSMFKEKVDSHKFVVNSVSGTSGAGATPSEKMHHPEVSGNVRPYQTLFHRHTPEVESILKDSFSEIKISFIPAIADLKRGIVSSITAFTDSEIEKVNDRYKEHYKHEPFVRVTDEVPEVMQVCNTNYCDINAAYDARTGRVIVISAIDNLIKGGSGQAIQNMNLMMGFQETDGLRLVAGHP